MPALKQLMLQLTPAPGSSHNALGGHRLAGRGLAGQMSAHRQKNVSRLEVLLNILLNNASISGVPFSPPSACRMVCASLVALCHTYWGFLCRKAGLVSWGRFMEASQHAVSGYGVVCPDAIDRKGCQVRIRLGRSSDAVHDGFGARPRGQNELASGTGQWHLLPVRVAVL